RSIKITPAVNKVGSLTVTLTITDSTGVEQTYQIPVLVQTNVVVLPFTDDFNRADNTFLGTAWSVLSSSGTIAIANNAALLTRRVAPNGASVAVPNGVVRSDVSLDVDVTLAVGQSAGLIARQSGTADTNLYLGTLTRTSTGYLAGIYRLFGGK